eukprot:CAMPEP_0115004052 /NCGR_PEP_ID=MMETSP0216-20121206/18977_1 /TAXON_ID=223996 /ORGANISM="Protocruzia adherens, Strain Boccale" /LENGTH=169 /DNA_ID=CAMNT_0002369975 /DNA_START=88 /DNA_END=598 /DNA_ORIENTATION=+
MEGKYQPFDENNTTNQTVTTENSEVTKTEDKTAQNTTTQQQVINPNHPQLVMTNQNPQYQYQYNGSPQVVQMNPNGIQMAHMVYHPQNGQGVMAAGGQNGHAVAYPNIGQAYPMGTVVRDNVNSQQARTDVKEEEDLTDVKRKKLRNANIPPKEWSSFALTVIRRSKLI